MTSNAARKQAETEQQEPAVSWDGGARSSYVHHGRARRYERPTPGAHNPTAAELFAASMSASRAERAERQAQ